MDRDKVKQLVSAAIDLPAEQREAYVRREAGGDQALLNEALSLLDAASNVEADGFLASDLDLRGPAVTAMPDEQTKKSGSTSSDNPQQFGRYRVLECIGEGGMGIVYRAEQRVPMRREVVVKVIKLGMDTKLVIARFEAERQALAMMDHPHIAKVYDAGTDEKGRPYFVMEYVKGTPIVDYCDRNHLSIVERLELFPQVCQAIQHAHHKGIIHRDIKPNNILVSTQDGKPFAKVIDFGIAKATNQRLTDRTLFTEHVNMIGTPAYMSPEQADGNIDIDTRTDVYSLGVVLYELLTGNTPFDSRRLKSAAINEIARIIREEDPPKPSTRVSTMQAPPVAIDAQSPSASPKAVTGSTLASLAKSRSSTGEAYIKSLRGEVDWIVMKALEKDRARRYETPNAIADDIDRYLNGVAIVAAPPSWGYRANKFIRKYKAPMVAGGLLTLLLLLGLAGTGIGLVQARAALSREKLATARESEAREDALLQAYIANIGAAQVAISGESWPEARQRLQACPTNCRGWEWQYLSNLTVAPEFGLPQPFASCKMSANGHLLLCQNGLQATVCDISTRRPVWALRFKESQYIINPNTPNETIYQTSDCPADISIDGAVAITSDNQIVVLNPQGDVRTRIKVTIDDYSTRGVSFSPAGKFIIFTHAKQFSVYDATTGVLVRNFDKPTGSGLQFSIDDELVAYNQVAKVAIYQARTPQPIKTVDFKGGACWSCAFSPDGTQLATGSNNLPGRSSIQIQSLQGESRYREFATGADVGISHVAFSPDGRFLLASDTRTMTRIFDLNSSALRASIEKASTSDARFSTDGSRILDPGNNTIWYWKRGDDRFELPAGDANIIGFSTDGEVAVSLDDYRVRIWKTNPPTVRPFSQVEFDTKSAGIHFLSLGGRELYLDEWSPAISDTVIALLKKPAGTASDEGVALSPDGRWTAKLPGDNSVTITDNTQGKIVATLTAHEGRVRALAFSPDGTRLVTGAEDCTMRFWDTQSWREVSTTRLTAPLSTLLFTSDGSRLIMGFSNKSIVSRDLRSYDARRKDAQALEAEQKRMKPYVENLINGNVAWDSLASTIFGDASLTDNSKIAALAELHEQLGNANQSATTLLSNLQSQWVTKNGVLAAAQKMELKRSVRKALDQQIEDWNPTQGYLAKEATARMSDPTLSREQYMDAMQAARDVAQSQADYHAAQYRYGVLLYRSGSYEQAINVLWQAESLKTAKFTAPIPPGQAAPTRPLAGDIDNDEAFIAMCQFKLGRQPQARATFQKVMRDFGRVGDRLVQIEAATLIDPATTRPVVQTQSPGLQAVGDALFSGDLSQLASHKDHVVRLKGHVVESVMARDKRMLNLVLDSRSDGVVVWISSDVLPKLPATFSEDVRDCDIVVAGLLHDDPSRNSRWKGRLELAVADPAAIQVLGHSDAYLHHLAAIAASQPAAVLDAANLDLLEKNLNEERLVQGTVKQARVTQGGTSIQIDFGTEGDMFQIYIAPSAYLDFVSRYNLVDPQILVGRQMLVNGVIIPYRSALEIVVDDLKNVDLLSAPATVTQPVP